MTSSINKLKKRVLGRTGRKGPRAPWAGLQVGAATVAISLGVPQKIKNRTTFGPSNHTSGCFSEEIQNAKSKQINAPGVYYGVVYDSPGTKGNRAPVGRQSEDAAVPARGGILLGRVKG